MRYLYFIGPLVVVGASFICWLILSMLLKYKDGGLALDFPNERSHHTQPVPRGGGVVIVGIAVMALGILMWTSLDTNRFVSALGIGILSFGIVGWLDDHRSLRVRTKLLFEFIACVIIVSLIRLPGEIQFAGLMIREVSPMLMIPLVLLWIIWMANLYNFMDGVDGFVGSQAILASIVIAVWFLFYGDLRLALFCLAIAGSVSGFLFLNWSPARVFLGDVGSLTLGVIFALLALHAVSEYQMPLSAFILLYGIFLFDSTVTLCRRFLSGERWWEPHATHLYQRFARSGVSDARLSILSLLASGCLAILGSLEVFGVGPEVLWFLLGLGVVMLMMWGVLKMEQRSLYQ